MDIKTMETFLIKDMKIIKDPTIIKITTIKRKYLDQIPERGVKNGETFINGDDIIFIGKTMGAVIFSRNGKLEQMRTMDFVRYYAEEFNVPKDREGYEVMEEMPELFLD